MIRYIVTLALLLAMFGCGGGTASTPSTKSSAVSAPVYTSVLCVGNSITRHGPSPSIGWDGDWGMAASSQASDYCHMVARVLNLPATAINVAALETNPTDLSPLAGLPAVTAETFVILELGDNSADPIAFEPTYQKLVQTLHPNVCTSTWWNSTAMDAMTQKNCTGKYAFIGDIFNDPSNPDMTATPFADAGVNRHPHDWGMMQIANRILAVR